MPTERRASWPRRIVLGLLAVLVAIQLVPYGRGHANPPVTGEPEWDSARTRELFFRVCGDCHSHETEWPWYSWVAPTSWLVARDVEHAREHFNVSTFDQGPGEADEAAEMYESGEMPLWFYTPLHPDADLGDDERQELLAGLRATFADSSDDD